MSLENMLLRGERGSYRVRRLIGRGGMSDVWLGEEISTHQKVAIKVPNGAGTPLNKLIFERDLLKQMSHIHIVNYVDSGIFQYTPFLVMEFAGGRNLEQVASGNPLDEKDAKIRAVELLLAIDYLHSMNVIHRDVKPRNIIVGSKDYLKLLDLGTATFFNTAGVGEAIISPGGYTAPEQYRFTSSIQGDIWSVAATCFFMVTGQHPIIAMPNYPNVRFQFPPDPRKFNRDLSDDFSKTIMRGMMWDPVERFSTAREMIVSIEKGVPRVPRKGPLIEVFGKEIIIDAPRLRFGRATREFIGTMITHEGEPHMPKERVFVRKEGDVIDVKVYDPYNWISRKHFEIFERGGRWYFKDLGSLNRSAILTKGVKKEVWAGHMRESPAYELGEKAMIYLAYGSSIENPPYLVITFKNLS